MTPHRSRWRMTLGASAAVAAFTLSVAPSAAQVPRAAEVGGYTASLGQPKVWHWQLGLGSGAWNAGPGSSVMLRAEFGTYHSLVNPVASFAEIGLEGYAGSRSHAADGGLRAILRVPYLGMGVGADYNIHDGRTDLLYTAYTPVRRGGVFQHGTMLRLNWYPFRSGWTIGVTAPLGDRLAGRHRPVREFVVVAADRRLPAPHRQTDPALLAALDSVRASAEWVRRLVVPFLDHDARTARMAEARTRHALTQLRSHLALRSAEDEVRFYHRAVERAFAIAAGSDAAGAELAAKARELLLSEILIPYDRLLGRKKHNDTIEDLAVAAQGRFGAWLATGGVVPEESGIERSKFVFQALTRLLETVRRRNSEEWDDARLAWLPLQFGLLPEQHDEQAELDALVERVTGGHFREDNQLTYVANLQFHAELLKMIGETRDYQVLWIHDFPAVTAGRLDWASAAVVHRYLETLTARVQAYDSTLRLPSFFILLDQHYYEARGSRHLMTILEDPLAAKVALPRATAQEVTVMTDDLRRLREAVHHSRALMAEAREYGDRWLHNRIKVHVNITNRADPSFWSGGLVSTLFGYPDDVMRDHRKVAFRDVREDQPDSGRAILTGHGVGQQYLGPGWDDRSLLVRGVVLADLKGAMREMLLSQGLTVADLPWPLLAVASAPRNAAGSGAGRAVLLSNGVGFQAKPVDVAKAVLYSLMPPGSVFKIPDSLWNSEFFAGLLTGAAIRGCHVLIIAPGRANAPSAGFPQMARAYELFARLLLVREVLALPIATAGGELRSGLYALPVDAHGFASRAERWVAQTDTSAFLRALLPFVADVEPVVRRLAQDSTHWQPPIDSAGVPLQPRLHYKVQFIATAPLWHAITHSAAWPRFMDTYLRYRQETYDTTLRYDEMKALTDSLETIAVRIAGETRGVSGAASFVIQGSQNMDNRGMFMDGEIGLVFTGPQALVPLVDLVFLAGTVTWVDDRATLDRLIPPPSELQRRWARLAKDGV